MRIGLGCRWILGFPGVDPERVAATMRAALTHGVTFFEVHPTHAGNERLLSRTLGHASSEVRVIVPCGLARYECGVPRSDGLLRPDGRATTIVDDVAASVEALAPLTIDLLLLQGVNHHVPLAESMVALANARDRGLTRRIGLRAHSLREVRAALKTVTIDAVEVALGAHDDGAARDGLVRWCGEHGITVLARSPFGGSFNASRSLRDPIVREVARREGASEAQVILSYLLAVHPAIVPIVGARNPEQMVDTLGASSRVLSDASLAQLDVHFSALGALRAPPARPPITSTKEVVLVMGIPGAGKSRFTESLCHRGYVRLNRDTLGGSLRGIVRRLHDGLSQGGERFVLDNTYVSRDTRCDVVTTAHRHGAQVRCIYLNTPLAEANVNVVWRMLDRYGHLLGPLEIEQFSKRDPNLFHPTVMLYMLHNLEPPTEAEGFSSIEVVNFVRLPRPEQTRPGAFIGLDMAAAVTRPMLPQGIPVLLFGHLPNASDAVLGNLEVRRVELGERWRTFVELGICTHGDENGRPSCWCRPPLPGLFVDFARRHQIDLQQSLLFGTGSASAEIARSMGARIVWVR